MAEADPSHYVRGQYRGYLDVDGVAPSSQTETFCAHATRDRQLALVRRPVLHPRRESAPGHGHRGARRLQHDPLARLRPEGRAPPRGEPARAADRSASPGARLRMQAKDAEETALRSVQLDMEFASIGGEGPTPYEVLLDAAMRGNPSQLRPPGRGRGDVARRPASASTRRRPVEVYEPGTWGPGVGGRAHP